MTSPMQRYRARIVAEKAIENGEALPEGSPHLLTFSLTQDLKRLKDIQLGEARNPIRLELIQKYQPYIDEYLEKGEVYENKLLMWFIIWCIDAREFEQALSLAKIAIIQQQPMPSIFNSDLATFIADSVLQWAETEHLKKHSVEPYFSEVFELVTDVWSVPAIVQAKYYKFASELPLNHGTPADITDRAVLENMENQLITAFTLYPKLKVKSLLDKIQQRLRALPATPHAERGQLQDAAIAPDILKPDPSALSDDNENV